MNVDISSSFSVNFSCMVEHFVEWWAMWFVAACAAVFLATNAVVASQFRVFRVACVVFPLRLMLARPWSNRGCLIVVPHVHR